MAKTRFIVIFILTSLCNWEYCYSQSLLLQKCLGGFNRERGKGVRQTSDGGYIICGYKESNDGDVTCGIGYRDGWLVKLDPAFNIEWQKCFGYANSDIEFTCIDLTTDGGYILGGQSLLWQVPGVCYHGSYDYFVWKLDSLGNVQWQMCYGGSDYDFLNDIRQTSDGGFILGGSSYSVDGDLFGRSGCNGCDGGFWLLKINSFGIIEWSKTYGSPFSGEACSSVIETEDHHFIACGYALGDGGDVIGSHGSFDVWVIKVDSLGNLVWQKPLGGSSSDSASDLVALDDGGVMVIGEASSNNGDVNGNHGGWDTWLIKLDSNGTIVWSKTYGGSSYDSGRAIAKDWDDGFMLLSAGSSIDGDASCFFGSQFWFTKIDSAGNFQYQKCVGGSDFDIPWRVISTSDSSFVAVGFTFSNNGDVIGNHYSANCSSGFDCSDFWIVKIGSILTSTNVLESSNDFFSASLNSGLAELLINVKLKNTQSAFVSLFDLTGKLILKKNILISGNEVNNYTISTPKLPPGIYLVRINLNNSQFSIKVSAK